MRQQNPQCVLHLVGCTVHLVMPCKLANAVGNSVQVLRLPTRTLHVVHQRGDTSELQLLTAWCCICPGLTWGCLMQATPPLRIADGPVQVTAQSAHDGRLPCSL